MENKIMKAQCQLADKLDRILFFKSEEMSTIEQQILENFIYQIRELNKPLDYEDAQVAVKAIIKYS